MPKASKLKRKKRSETTPGRSKEAQNNVRLTPDYEEYLERYEELGQGRRKLASKEFDQLDDEMLELLGAAAGRELSDEEQVRLQELEYLLIDTE